MYDPLFEAWCRGRLGKASVGAAGRTDERIASILAALSPEQRAYVEDKSSRFAALTARGSGKTTAARARFVIKGLRVKRARLLFIATTKEQAEDLMWEPLKSLCDRLGIKTRVSETKLRMVLVETGAVIRLVGADDKRTIEKLRGLPWHEVIIDEAASYPIALLSNLMDRVIGPRLGDFGGVLGMQGTPGHVLNGQFYDVTRIGSEQGQLWAERDLPWHGVEEPWSVHKWNLQHQMAAGIKAAFGLWSTALAEKKRKQWGDRHPIWMREYLGFWAADDTAMMYKFRAHDDEGKPFNIWDAPREGKTPDSTGWATLPPGNWSYGLGMDLGHGTPFALQVLAYDRTDPGRRIYQVFEFVRRGMYAGAVADLLLGETPAGMQPRDRLKAPRGIVGRIGWPDCMVADLSNLGDAFVLELAEVYGIQITAAQKANKPGAVELTNGDLQDQRVWVLKDSKLQEQMAQLQWRVDEFGLLKEPKHGDDACDGFIYPRREISSFFTGPARPSDPVFPALRDAVVEDEKPRPAETGFELLSDGGYYDEAQDGWGSW